MAKHGFRLLHCPCIVIAMAGQYSHYRKFVKYSYANRKVVTLTHSGTGYESLISGVRDRMKFDLYLWMFPTFLEHHSLAIIDLTPVYQSQFAIMELQVIEFNSDLRLLDTFASKIAKICNFWTFRLVIQVIEQLFKIRQKAFLSDFEKMVY